MKKDILLSSATLTLVGLLSFSGCGDTKKEKTNDPAYGANYQGESATDHHDKAIQVPLKATSKSGQVIDNGIVRLSSLQTKVGRDCTVTQPCTVKVVRNCYKDLSGKNTITGYDNAAVRCAAFMNLDDHIAKGYTIPEGTAVRFSGVLDITDTSGALEAVGSMKVTLKAPPCATDKEGNRWYVNNDDLTEGTIDTQTLLVLISAPNNACAVSATQKWVTLSIKNPLSLDLRTAILEAEDVDISSGVRLTIFAIQKDADVVAGEDKVTEEPIPVESDNGTGAGKDPVVLPPLNNPERELSPLNILENSLNKAFKNEQEKDRPIGGAVLQKIKLLDKLENGFYLVTYTRGNGNFNDTSMGIYDTEKKVFIKKLTFYHTDSGTSYGEKVDAVALVNKIVTYTLTIKDKKTDKITQERRTYNTVTDKIIKKNAGEPISIKALKALLYTYGNTPTQTLKDQIEKANTSQITDMSHLFVYSSFDGDISGWDTSKVTNMSSMFQYSQTKLPEYFDTSKVTNMGRMFKFSEMTQLPKNFDTSKVTNMAQMFQNSAISTLPKKFDTSKVTDMSGMFIESKISTLPESFDTSKVTTMSGMFIASDISSLPENLDTSKVTNMGQMFLLTKNFNQDISHWDVSHVEKGNSFNANSSLETKNIPAKFR